VYGNAVQTSGQHRRTLRHGVACALTYPKTPRHDEGFALAGGTSAHGIVSDVKIQDWRRLLLTKATKSGDVLRPVAANAITILTHDPVWSGVLAYDEFAETIVTRAVPPWRPHDLPDGCTPGDWADEDTIRVQAWLADAYGIDVSEGAALAAVKIAAARTRYHPVREWLEGLRWDTKRRLSSWLTDVFGAEDTPYTRAVGKAWAISAVARIMTPGCKVDTVLVLEGKPGVFKSSVLRALVGDAWFIEMGMSDVANKDAMQVLRRKWIGEFPEIDGLSKAEQASVKSFFSRQVDTYRPSYGKGSKDFPRQTVFAATTNKSEYLTDETGGTGRRMWPVQCREGNLAAARAMRDQFWAEAVTRFHSSEEWFMRDPALRDAEREEQDKRFRSDPWEQPIATWLARPTDIPVGGSRAVQGVTTHDVLACLTIDLGRRTHADATRVGAVLRRLGWVPGNPELRQGARVRVYRPMVGAGTNGHTLMPSEGAHPAPRELEPAEPTQDDLFPPDEAFAE
jgi:putative DNA primase/helicase